MTARADAPVRPSTEDAHNLSVPPNGTAPEPKTALEDEARSPDLLRRFLDNLMATLGAWTI